MKMKEFGPPGGGARPWRPPLDPPMLKDSNGKIFTLQLLAEISCTFLNSKVMMLGEGDQLESNVKRLNSSHWMWFRKELTR